MISGFKLKITASELRTHCTERGSYHDKRATEKSGELPSLREAMQRLKAATGAPAATVSHMSKGGYHLDADDPVRDLENDIRDHRNKATVFRFFSEHLFDEDYTLEENDLKRLEILKP